MKIVCNRDKLHDALQVVSGMIPARHTRPILQNLKIEPDGDALDLVATDLEVGIRHRLVPEQVEDPRPVALPGQTLANIVREVRDENVTINIDGASASVSAGRSRFKLVVVDPEDYPEVPKFEEGGDDPIVDIPALDMVDLIARTAFAVATEQNRYAINGVYFHVKGKSIEMVATDGRRLARASRKLKSSTKMDSAVIVPPKMMRELEKRATGREDATVRILTGGNQILACIGETTLVGRLVEGNYPRYQDVIPKESAHRMVLKREELAARLKQALVLTSEETRSVSLEFASGILKLESRAPERGEASLEMDVNYDGEAVSVAFNPAFLSDVLRVLGSDEVTLELTDGEKPGVVRDGDEFIYVIMPVTSRG